MTESKVKSGSPGGEPVSVEDVRDKLVTSGVKWVLCAFTDLRGIFQSFSSPIKLFVDEEQYFESGIGFDGSSIRGFKELHTSDMIFFPNKDAVYVLPWTKGDQRSAVIIGDIREPFGSSEASDVDPRGYVARRALEKAAKMGYTPYFGPEIEFFIFQSIDPSKLDYDIFVSPSGGAGDSWGPPRVNPVSPETTVGKYILRPKEAYFRNPPEDSTHEYRNNLANALQEMGYTIEMHHHEVSTKGQCELNFRFGSMLETADRVQIYKLAARNIAAQYGWIATFMPKPIYLDNASGMHVHNSLFKNGSNAFWDPSDDYAELSQEARYYIGGLLEHASALTAITCPTVNSYKRLVPGFEAPINVMYSRRNRSALIRIPVYLSGEKYANRRRIEYRGVDPSTNPYFAFAGILSAGLDGIKKKIEPGDPVDKDVYEMSASEKKAAGISQLPTTLRDALDALESDELFKDVLGSHIYDAFVDYKTHEWNQYCLYVSPWEIMKYLDY
ncbi:MAG: type I glutamate--ammonia ligase [Candidatus Lokiarchaeota archaeon]|nr:type I glutamate--ammonia ligase [Candidatus Lokiarchaeota archaeon]MBD3340620.1 type I glutamate--ammonia ligase [Candidatus Lokiarchaeota archaeon]